MLKKMLTFGLCFLLFVTMLSGCASNVESRNYEQTIATARTEIWKVLTAGGASSATVAIMDS